MSSVWQLQAETIGLPGLSNLWILGKKSMTGVLGVVVNRLEAEAVKWPAWMKWLMVVLKVMLCYWLETFNHILKEICVYVYILCTSRKCYKVGVVPKYSQTRGNTFLTVGKGVRLSRVVWGHPRQKSFNLVTVLSYFHAKIPPIKQWTSSNFFQLSFIQTLVDWQILWSMIAVFASEFSHFTGKSL